MAQSGHSVRALNLGRAETELFFDRLKRPENEFLNSIRHITRRRFASRRVTWHRMSSRS